MITAGIAAWQSTGSTIFMPWHLSNLTRAYGELGQFDDAWCCIDKAIQRSKQPKKDGSKPRPIASQAKSR